MTESEPAPGPEGSPAGPCALERLQLAATKVAAGCERYSEIVQAAMEIVGSDAASMQLLDHDGGGLRLVGWRGFDPASAAFWGLVVPDSACTCGIALANGARVVVSDVEAAEALADSEDLEEYRRSGLRAVQSTPLVAGDGRVLGMVSTHWRRPHEVRADELLAVDLLAQVARMQGAALLDWAEKSEAARRQYKRAVLNHHLVTNAKKLETDFGGITDGGVTLTVLCECGRDRCQEVVALPFAVDEWVRDSPHHLVVAAGHAATVDDVIAEGEGFEIVVIKPEYRDPSPPTADLEVG